MELRAFTEPSSRPLLYEQLFLLLNIFGKAADKKHILLKGGLEK